MVVERFFSNTYCVIIVYKLFQNNCICGSFLPSKAFNQSLENEEERAPRPGCCILHRVFPAPLPVFQPGKS